MELLLLRLEGAFQSWGLRAHWDERDTAHEPTKSGIIGLLGCCLGYERTDIRIETELGKLTMGIRVDRPLTNVLSDYHTASGFKVKADGGEKLDTIVSNRDYLENAAFLVVIGGDPQLLHKVADAVQHPKWVPYLGRKCCVPARPLFERIAVDYVSIEDAIQHEPRCILPMSGDNEDRLRYTIDDVTGDHRQYDELRCNLLRIYDVRQYREAYTEVKACISPV